MKSVKLLFFASIIVSTFTFISCTKEKVDESFTCYEFNEEYISSEQINAELNENLIISLDSEGALTLVENPQEVLYTKGKDKIILHYEGDFNNWYIRQISETEEIISTTWFSEIEGLNAESIEKIDVSSPMDYIPLSEIKVYPLENGNIMLVADFIEVIKLFELNFEEKKIVNSTTYEDINDGVSVYNLCYVTKEQTIFSNYTKGELLFYDNFSGELIKTESTPGKTEDVESLGTSAFKTYDGYLYTTNEKGIFRCDESTMQWDCLISNAKTEELSEYIMIKDFLIASETELYVAVVKEIDEDGIYEKVDFVKFTLN